MPDERLQALAQIERRDQEFMIFLSRWSSRQVIEQVSRVFSYLLITAKQAEIFIHSRRDRIVVTGRKVDIPAQNFLLLTDDHDNLAVSLIPRQSMDHIDARLFQEVCPGHIGLLVKSC